MALRDITLEDIESLAVGAWVIGPDVQQAIATPTPPMARMVNTEALGQVLYTRYVYFFQAAGVVLLVAMIGAILLAKKGVLGMKEP